MFNFRGFFGAVKQYPVPFFLTLFVVVVFISAPFLFVYRKVRAVVPGGTALPEK